MAKTNIGGELHSVATGNIVASTVEVLDLAKNKNQQVINADFETALSDRYTKAEVELIIDERIEASLVTPEALYINVDTFGDLPETGENDVVYRVANYDGSLTNTSKYCEYAWTGSLYKLLNVVDHGIDDVPSLESDNPVKGSGIADTYGSYQDTTSGWIYKITDAEDKILFGIKSDGSVLWYIGFPEHLRQYILENAYKWLKDDDSQGFLYKITDSEDKVVFGIKQSGEIYSSNMDPKVAAYINKAIPDKLYNNFTEFRPTGIPESIFKVDTTWNVKQFGVGGNHYNNYLSVGINDSTNPNVIQGNNYDWLDGMAKYTINMGAETMRLDFYSWRSHGTTPGLSDEQRLKKVLDYYKNIFYVARREGLKILATYSPHQNGHWNACVKDRMWNPAQKKYTWDGYLEFEKKAFQMLASKNLGLQCRGGKYSIDSSHPAFDITPDFIELTNEFDIEDNMYLFAWNGEFDGNGDRVYDENVKAQNWFNFWKMAYTTIKETNPNIKVFMGGLASLANGTLRRMAEITDSEGHRFWDFFDVYNFHSYATVDELYGSIRNHQEFMIKCLSFGGKTKLIDKPVVITEYGANYYDNTEEYIADTYVKKTIILQSSGILICFPFKLMSMERDLYNGSWSGNGVRYGIIHDGTTNSRILLLRNDGTETAIGNGGYYESMKFTLYNGIKMVALRAANDNIINRLKEQGLVVKKLDNYTISEIRVYNNPSDVYLSNGIKFRNEGITIYTYIEGTRQPNRLVFNKEFFKNIVTNSVVVVIGGNDVVTDNKWNHNNPDLAKLPYKALLTYSKFHDENCSRPVVNLTEDGIYVASWINKDKEIIYAIWSKIGMKSNKITVNTPNHPIVYNKFGEIITNANKHNLDISNVVYLTNVGNIKVKRI